MSAPALRSVPYLRFGVALMGAAILIWVISAQYFLSSIQSGFGTGGGGVSDPVEQASSLMRLLPWCYGAAAITFVGGVVLTALGLIQYNHLFRASLAEALREHP